jgi:hypothetical protein
MKLASLHDELLYEENRLQRYYQNAKAAAATATQKLGNKLDDFYQNADPVQAVDKRLQQYYKNANSSQNTDSGISWTDRKQAFQNELALNTVSKKIYKALNTPFKFPEFYADYRNAFTKDRTNLPRMEAYALEELKRIFNDAEDIISGNFVRDPKNKAFRFIPPIDIIKVLAPRTDPNTVYKTLFPTLVNYEKELKQDTAYSKAIGAAREKYHADRKPDQKQAESQSPENKSKKEEEAYSYVQDSESSRPEPPQSEGKSLQEIPLMEAGVLGSAAKALLNPRGSLVSHKPQISVNDLKWLEGYYRNIMLHRKMMEMTVEKYTRAAIKAWKASPPDNSKFEQLWSGVDNRKSPKKLIELLSQYPNEIDAVVLNTPENLKDVLRMKINAFDILDEDDKYLKYIRHMKNVIGLDAYNKLTAALGVSQ